MSFNPNIALTLYQAFNLYPIQTLEVKTTEDAENFINDAKRIFKQAGQALKQYNPNRMNKKHYLLIEKISESEMSVRVEKIRKIQAYVNILAAHLSTAAQQFGLMEKIAPVKRQIARVNYACIIFLEQYNHFLKERTLQFQTE